MDTKFKVGQKVWCENVNQTGTISRIVPHHAHPIKAETVTGAQYSYTLDGKFFESHKEPSLFLIEEEKEEPKEDMRLYEVLAVIKHWEALPQEPPQYIQEAYLQEIKRIIG